MNIEEDLKTDEIIKLLKTQNILIDEIRIYQKYGSSIDYLINNEFILSISKKILGVQMKHNRVKSVSFVPKIHYSGDFVFSNEKYYFYVADYLKGNNLWNEITKLTGEQKIEIGKSIVQFLNELHSITGHSYDIGHYIPTIPNCMKTWKIGHIEYIELLKNELSTMEISPNGKQIISKAFDYIYENLNSLEYQIGARILHNDFHPKNIIISEGKLVGIIDWECSQFGEPDFELVHLFHWCIYPSDSNNNIELLLKYIIENLQSIKKIPNIKERLTIYQLEHDLNQLIWNGIKQEKERIEKINGWLTGNIDTLYKKLKI
jgi:thiamine kinase-like enzyme